jgi:ketosteroid isomerase-like protein
MTFLALVLAPWLVLAGPAAPAPTQGQVASVTEAQAALIEALAKHDKAAFERVLDADPVFFLPTLCQGREAVLKSWIIFVLPSNATMTLAPIDAVAASSQDLAYTTGTYRFTTQNGGTTTTVMSGTYMAVWRMADGRWTLKAFAGAGERAAASPGVAPPGLGTGAATAGPPVVPASLANGGGLGPYRFGMPLEDVRKIDACKPYLDVKATGGLECPNYVFEGRKINISFLFAANALRRIQLWSYEGASEKDARKAVDAGIEFLKRTAGDVHMYGLPAGTEITGESLVRALKKEQVQAGRSVVAELQTPSSASPEKWFARLARSPMPDGDMLYVFLFVEARLPQR